MELFGPDNNILLESFNVIAAMSKMQISLKNWNTTNNCVEDIKNLRLLELAVVRGFCN